MPQELIPYVKRIKTELHMIEIDMIELLEASTIKEFRNDPYSNVLFVSPQYYWGEPDEHQQRLQIKLRGRYSAWIEHFRLLLRDAPESTKEQIEEIHKFILNWIDKEAGDWSVQQTIPECILKFREQTAIFQKLLSIFDEEPDRHNVVLVPDTNSLIICPDLAKYSEIVAITEFTIVLVPTVLEELDKLKVVHRDRDFRDKVNSVIRRIKGLRQQGSLLDGVTINRTITVKMIAKEPVFSGALHWLDPGNNDDRVIASVLEIQRHNSSSTVVLVTSDINLQNKAELANVPYLEPPGDDS